LITFLKGEQPAARQILLAPELVVRESSLAHAPRA
jgi:hypothetical protein